MANKRRGRVPPPIKPSTDMSSLGILLASYMSKHNITIMDLSRKLGIADRQIRDWVIGHHYPTMGSLWMICEVIAKEEECFIETIMMEAMCCHDYYITAKRREARRYATKAVQGV
jgi:transcriptional regulator with XRE-family HTH domain